MTDARHSILDCPTAKLRSLVSEADAEDQLWSAADLSDVFRNSVSTDALSSSFALSFCFVSRSCTEEQALPCGSVEVNPHRESLLVGSSGEFELITYESDSVALHGLAEFLASESLRLAVLEFLLITLSCLGVCYNNLHFYTS